MKKWNQQEKTVIDLISQNFGILCAKLDVPLFAARNAVSVERTEPLAATLEETGISSRTVAKTKLLRAIATKRLRLRAEPRGKEEATNDRVSPAYTKDTVEGRIEATSAAGDDAVDENRVPEGEIVREEVTRKPVTREYGMHANGGSVGTKCNALREDCFRIRASCTGPDEPRFRSVSPLSRSLRVCIYCRGTRKECRYRKACDCCGDWRR